MKDESSETGTGAEATELDNSQASITTQDSITTAEPKSPKSPAPAGNFYINANSG